MRYTPEGKSVTDFSMAVSTNHGQNQETIWFKVVSWNSLAEVVNQHLHKGSLVFVEGRLRVRNWEARDGSRRTTFEVIANRILFLDSKSRANGDGAQQSQSSGEIPFQLDGLGAP